MTMDQPKLPEQNGFSVHQEIASQAQLGSSTESKVIMETTRTTSATMRLEHKSNYPDLPITFSQRTQTPTIPLVSEGTMIDSDLRAKQQSESTQTANDIKKFLQKESTVLPPKDVQFPFIDTVDGQVPQAETRKSALEFFENNMKNLPALSEEKYTRFEEAMKGSKTYVNKQHEIKETFKSKLNDDLSFLNLQPEPAPEMGFMPKLQAPIAEKPEKIIEKVKKLEQMHQTNETPLSGTVFPQGIRKEEKYEKKEFISTKSSSPFPVHKPMTPSFMQRDQLSTDFKVTRSSSPKPSMEAVNMEKLWTTIPKSPEPLTQQQQQQQNQSFTHEHKSSFVAYSSHKQMTQEFSQEQPQIQPQRESFMPIQVQPYQIEPQNQEELPKASIKDTKSFFEQRIKEEEQKAVQTELKAPGLVKQFAKPMVPLIPIDLEPGSPPEILYAPKPVLERKQSYVEKIEKTLEQNIEKEPEKVPRGGIRIFPQRQTPQRTAASPQRAPSPKTVIQQPPPVQLQPEPMPELFKAMPIVLTDPFVAPAVPQKFSEQFSSSQFETKEFRSENTEIKKESETISGYRRVAPTFLSREKAPEPVAPPPLFSDLFKAKEPEVVVKPQVIEIPIQKPEVKKQPIYQQPPPQMQQKPTYAQPTPSTYVAPPMANFNEPITNTKQGSHSLYKNFVQSEKTVHSSESYFQRVDSPKVIAQPQQPPQQQQQQFKKPEPQKQQQVRRKFLPDVML